MRPLVAIVTLAVSVISGGCASHRALREDTTEIVILKDAAARRVYYQAAVSVMSREGYGLLHAADPDGFGIYRERLRPEQGGEGCEDVRLDASFETGEDRATFAFAPCLVERKGELFREAGLEICIPQVEWRSASCIDAAVARIKGAWRDEAQELMSKESAAARARQTSSRPPPSFNRAAMDSAPIAGACMKDTECKGERICDSGRCVDPARR
jgi:hypothetical protein